MKASYHIGNLLTMIKSDPSGCLKTNFSYDRFDHLIKDENHTYMYDNLGNCLKKDSLTFQINNLNQLTADSNSVYSYDLNGNLTFQTNPFLKYTYDSLNRLKTAGEAYFTYDAFGKCATIDEMGIKNTLLYVGEQEIGSVVNGQIQELRIVHPEAAQETTFAIEINQIPYFPIKMTALM